MSKIQSFGLKDRANVCDVVLRSMRDDTCAQYIAKNGHVTQLIESMMGPYWSSQPMKLHLMTEGCHSVVIARFHPTEKVQLRYISVNFCHQQCSWQSEAMASKVNAAGLTRHTNTRGLLLS